MSAPTVTANAYNDNAVPHGSRYEDFKSGTQAGASDIGYYCLENITPNRVGVKTFRPDSIGGPNGFVLVKGQDTMTAKAQIATNTTPSLKRGYWFKDSFDPADGTVVEGLPSTTPSSPEVWVITDSSDKFEINGYWYQDITLAKAISPP